MSTPRASAVQSVEAAAHKSVLALRSSSVETQLYAPLGDATVGSADDLVEGQGPPPPSVDDAHMEALHSALETEGTILEVPESIATRPSTPPVNIISLPGWTRNANQGTKEEDTTSEREHIPLEKIKAKAARRKKKKHHHLTNTSAASPALATIRGFTPAASGDEDSDYSNSRSNIGSPRIPLLAGASPGLRCSSPSPAVSNLKLQLDALNLSRPESRSMSRTQSKLGSQSPSSTSEVASDIMSETELTETISYEVPLDQDFITSGVKQDSLVGLGLDARQTSMHRKMAADDFTPLKCLGKGTYGTVLLVKQNETGRLYAQKQFRKASLTVHKKLVEQTKTERTILESVNRHPFIVDLLYAFQDRERLYLILEYAQGGELFHHLELEKMFSEDVTAFYMAEMILALEHLHHNVGVIYRDLKPENCLLDSEGHLLLTDFGLSKVALDEDGPGSRCNSSLGTIEYMAPEVIVSDLSRPYGKACDWWCLGALGFDLLTGSPPFGGNNYTKIQNNILRQKLNLPFFLSADAKDLLNRLMRKEPSKRLGYQGRKDIQTMKKHRFFRKIDWKKLEARELTAPIQPLITDPELAENFHADFTQLAISPIEGKSGPLSATDPFGGFSFVASHSLLNSGDGFGDGE